ncbi:MAG TPA: hypothetical protein VK338_04240 [Candidatus Nitrosocosmicus sp.]|nr:hypothetical protein [Candidatus Nitrosocosmicus sp.]
MEFDKHINQEDDERRPLWFHDVPDDILEEMREISDRNRTYKEAQHVVEEYLKKQQNPQDSETSSE